MDRHNVLSNYKMAREFKKNNKNKSLKEDADEENNALSFAQIKLKYSPRGTKEHRVPDCKK